MKRAPAAILAGLAALALAGWWLIAARGGADARRAASAEPVPGEAAVDTAVAPAPAKLEAARGEAGAAPGAPRAAAPGSAAVATAARLPREADVRRVRVLARVEDPQGRPIAGAALLSPPDDAGAVLARTDAEGRLDAELELAVDRAPLAQWITIERLPATVAAQGFVARSVELDVHQDVRFHLGTLVLVPGVPVSGRVVDAAGRGVGRADIEWYPAAQLELLRSEVATGELDFLPQRSDTVHADLELGGTSASDGSFHLLGVPREPGLLAGIAEGHGIGLTEVLPFDAGERLDVRLALSDGTPSVPPAGVAGTVVRPDGTPHPGAELVLLASDRSMEHGSGTAGADGRFEVLLPPWAGKPRRIDGPLIVRAVDPEQRFSAGETAGVLPDGRAVVVQLTPARLVEVRLVDPEGNAVPWGHVRSNDADEPWPLTPFGEEGRGAFLLPGSAFRVEAFAPGFRTELFGPFEPARVGPALELRLTPGEAVRGRVLAGGEPVEGARVALTRTPFRAGLVGRARGVAPIDRPFDLVAAVAMDEHDATTAPDGSFVATLPDDGWFTVAAEADGYARRVLGPFEWTRAEGASGLLLELERPGSIEGRLRVPAGERVEGRLVAASDGLGEAWIAAADAQGRFRFEGLAPGGWQLRPGVPPLRERQRMSSNSSPSAREVRFDVVVRAGEETSAVLDLASLPEHVLQGRIELDGAGLAGAQVELHPGETTGRLGEHVLASASTDDDGAFALRLFSGGPVLLSVSKDGLRVLHRLELPPGVTAWELELERATLILSGSLPELPEEERPWHALRTRAPGGALAFRRVTGETPAGEPLRVEGVAAGEVELLCAPFREVMRRGYLDETLWTPIASVHLDPGAEGTLALP